MEAGLYSGLPPLSECLHAPASSLWGVYSASQRPLGGEWGDFPKAVVDVLGVRYELYRHPLLYNNFRVRKFLKQFIDFKMRGKPFKDVTGWADQAERIFMAAFESAKKQVSERGNSGN